MENNSWIWTAVAAIAVIVAFAYVMRRRKPSVKEVLTPQQRADRAALERELLRAPLLRTDPLPPPASLKGDSPPPPADDGVDWPALERLYFNPAQDAQECALLEPHEGDGVDSASRAAMLAAIAEAPSGRVHASILPRIGKNGREFAVYVRGALMGYADPEMNSNIYAIFNEGLGCFAWVRVTRKENGSFASELLFYS